MSKSLYFECYSGISGDMTVAALLDLGVDKSYLKEQLETLPVDGFRVEISRVKKSGLDACDFCVVLDEPYENHDHDIAYLYGHREEHTESPHGHGHLHEHEHMGGHEHMHEHEHIGGHEHMHEHEHLHGHGHEHHHTHAHRSLGDVMEIIDGSGISGHAKQIAGNIFKVLAQAEAKAHGSTVDQVHFHEVGAVDSIVDIAAAAVCLDSLGVENVIVPELYEGRGTVRCAHGILPVPVPAVMNIATDHGLKLHMTKVEAELVTPTGAAIVAAVATSDQLPQKYRVLASGMGAGKRDYGRTSLLRVMLIESEETAEQDVIYKLESNIDDCSGEAMGYVMNRLFEAGARDVSFLPVYMKKNRPAYEVHVICSEEEIARMEEILFEETTTIGIRRARMERTVLKREIQHFDTSLGEVRAKVCHIGGKRRIYPEYASVVEIARKTGKSYLEVFQQVQKEAQAE